MKEYRGKKYDYSREFTKGLTEALFDTEKNKLQFSFVSKLLNIINDEEFPIYDTNVITVFGLFRTAKKENDKKMEAYIEQYEIIRKTYKELLLQEDCQNIIGNFKDTFPQSKSLSDMKILDIIVWKIGDKMIKSKNKKQFN